MKKNVFVSIVAWLLLLANLALADDGNDLLAQCSLAVNIMDGKKMTADMQGSIDAGNSMYCFGLLQGIISLNKLYEVSLRNKALFCTPNSDITNGEAARVVVKYLDEHPEVLHEPDFAVVINALVKAYPCK
ncbi:hypothetical protein FCL47_00780 [Desulfopila sp. IMCC35006]|uniref:Rap1a/Tai family immunity protein n=1 Tax=Desulfopila sp. IMCC35006 TaxID=2569542 RepID=UPI0010AC25AC|nr:Rap1a/Tai family immunity protein [Desulfopila sp. IMCC35006]TKB28059.1 hypothetical protein FCL47_00780 [Desulfopila sp. IMCC35006]